MTKDELDAIRARVEAATPGPWKAERWCSNSPSVAEAWGLNGMRTFADAVFCGHAREDVPALLAEVERLTAERDRLTGLLDKVSDNHIASQLNGAREAIARKAAEAEVERLTAERAALQVGDTESTTLEANERFAPSEHVVVYIEKWCDGSGPCAVELEPHGHWRLSRSVSLASVRKAERDAAFQRGVAAMREAAAKELDRLLTKRKATAIWVGPDELRALPDPEDKP